MKSWKNIKVERLIFLFDCIGNIRNLKHLNINMKKVNINDEVWDFFSESNFFKLVFI